MYSAFIAIAVATAGTLAVAVFERLAIVRAEFAAVTAPKLEVRAPANGQLIHSGLLAGDRIARDAPLGKLADPDLEAELAKARSRYTYTDDLLRIISLQPAGMKAACLRPIISTPRASYRC